MGIYTMTLPFQDKIAEVHISYSTKIAAKDRVQIKSSKDTALQIRSFFPLIEYQEHFFLILLNRANRVLGYRLISTGGMAGTVVDVRLVFQVALLTHSTSIILVHNHPSGMLTPSAEDLALTAKFINAGKVLDISVLDHLIMTKDSYYSFADEGMMN